MLALAAAAAALWWALLLVPWRPWRAGPVLDAQAPARVVSGSVTAVIPARDEAALVARCVASVRAQGVDAVVVDDQSEDDTAAIARAAGASVVRGEAMPSGWSGKVWALEQGRAHATTDYVLLVDADIELGAGIVDALLAKMKHEGIAFASLVPQPRFEAFWEKLLMPAFVYFFALLYPFRLSSSPRSRVAAASGGCVLVERRALEAIGGFAALKGALIDDCTLARCVKRAGFMTWIGLTRSAHSLRPYPARADVWAMVERNAYTQLRYAVGWLCACTALMVLAFWVPVIALFDARAAVQVLGAAAIAATIASYLPTLRFYRRSPAWALALLVIATLFLAMTWTSALRYYRRERARWKGRVYAT
ncbi:MAG TPA: glycosyltransferase [Burkholderiales bacterium]|nr:glycosyltransferase [Burkholderiales bacterium]